MMRRAITAVAIGLIAIGVVSATAAEPADTLERLAAAGGKARRNDTGAVIDLDFRACAVTNDDLATIAKLPGLVALRLSGKSGATTVDDVGVARLAPLTTLRVLMLDHLWVSGEGLTAIAPLVNLEELTLAQTLVRDEDLAAIARFPQLRRLRLARTAVSGTGLAQLGGLENLCDLDLSESVQMDDAALEHVGRLASLRRLNLWRVPVGDAGVAHLAGLAELEWLNLDNTQLTDAGLAHLAGLGRLRSLLLGSTAVSSAGIGQLGGLEELRELSLKRTGVDEGAMQRLRASLPNLSISLRESDGE